MMMKNLRGGDSGGGVKRLLMIVPFFTLVLLPTLGVVRVAEGRNFKPRSVIQDRELCPTTVVRKKGSKKNARPFPAPIPAPIPAPTRAPDTKNPTTAPTPTEPVPDPVGLNAICQRCFEQTSDGSSTVDNSFCIECITAIMPNLQEFPNDASTDRKVPTDVEEDPNPQEAIEAMSSFPVFNPSYLDPTNWNTNFLVGLTEQFVSNLICTASRIENPTISTLGVYIMVLFNMNWDVLKFAVQNPLPIGDWVTCSSEECRKLVFYTKQYQKPLPLDQWAIGGPRGPPTSFWGGLTPLTYNDMFYLGTDNDRAHVLAHNNEAVRTKIVYKQELNDEASSTATHDIPRATTYYEIKESFPNILVGNCKYDKRSYPNHIRTPYAPCDYQTMNDMMDMARTDGIIVVKDGHILVEEYRNEFDRRTKHKANSATKSFAGVILAMLIEGKSKLGLDDVNYNDLVTDHLHYLKVVEGAKGAFEGATIRQVMDMTTEFNYEESGMNIYQCLQRVASRFHCEDDPKKRSEIEKGKDFGIPTGCEQLFAGQGFAYFPDQFSREFYYSLTNKEYARFPGPRNLKEGMMALAKEATARNGQRFTYRTANTVVIGLLIEKLLESTGGGLKWFSDNVWSKLGQNADQLWEIDERGFPNYGAGSMHTLMDAARYGEMMRNDGENYKNETVVPKTIVDKIKFGGVTEAQWNEGFRPENLNHYRKGNGGLDNCNLTTDPEACYECRNVETYKWLHFGIKSRDCPIAYRKNNWEDEKLPVNHPVLKYLEAIGEPNEKGLTDGYAYYHKYWVVPGHVFMQEGVHGQFVAVFPKIDMTIAIFSSQPETVAHFYMTINMMFTIAAEYAQKDFTQG